MGFKKSPPPLNLTLHYINLLIPSAKPKHPWLGLAENSRSTHFRPGLLYPFKSVWGTLDSIYIYLKQWLTFLPLECTHTGRWQHLYHDIV